jgi:N-acetylneuraminate synthase/N,N'-diacetyllegionaminate synthase
LRIGNKEIGRDDYCYIIAEAGSNHERNINNAFELIEVAASAEADAVKFQLFKANTLYSKYVDDATYKETKNLQLPLEWVPELIDKSNSQGITFLATPFDSESIDYLKAIDIPAVKWASGELNNIPLLSQAAKLSKPIIIATGMSSLGDIELAIETVKKEGNSQSALLHCISIYPTKYTDANLRMMDTLADAFDYPVGFSDHTTGIAIAIAAVARGARIIEKHFTLNRKMNSPDHPFSINPSELKEMVRSIRQVSDSLGTRHKHVIPNESKFLSYGKRSIVAVKAIPRGTTITKDMITTKRPGTGIPPQFIPSVIGRDTRKDLTEDEIITWGHFI